MPPPGKKFVVFVDDVNMLSLEQYGAQPAIELLRQFIDYRGVYETFNWKDVDNTILICACGPPGGGRSSISVRFTHHFALLSVTNSSDETLSWIYSTILKAFLKNNHFKSEIIDLRENYSIVNSTLQMYSEIEKSFIAYSRKISLCLQSQRCKQNLSRYFISQTYDILEIRINGQIIST